ncbi:hypothetical protein K7432_009411 [Basidiobolus ranarum]|uniref:Uncharacterized protein n=1 Tax=Basidiobolus ranarum TaxID=34480 RepID=A0ABR2VX57_9FUNG
MLKMKVPQTVAQDWRIKLSQIDFIGFALVVAATILISLPPIWGGSKYAWSSGPIIAFFVVGILLFIVFGVYILKLVKLEKPVIQTRLFRKSSMNWAIASTILQNAGVFGWMMYLTYYGGLVMNMSKKEIGYIQTPYVVCSAFSGILEGLLLTKFGNYKPFLVFSPLITISGLAITFAFSETTKPLMFVATGVVGIGVGSQYLSLVLSTQACHTHTDTAQAVMLLSFVAGLFGAFFTSITGAVFNTVHGANLEKYFPPGTPAAMLAQAKFAAERSSVPDPALLKILIQAWTDTMKTLGIYCIGLVAAAYILSWFIKPYKLTENIGDAPERIPIKGVRGFLGMKEKDSQDKF